MSKNILLISRVFKTEIIIKSLNATSYMVQEGRESLLGRREGEALGMIKIDPNGEGPTTKLSAQGGQNTTICQYDEEIFRLDMLHRPIEGKPTLDTKQQKELDARITKLMNKIPRSIFWYWKGEGEAKTYPPQQY